MTIARGGSKLTTLVLAFLMLTVPLATVAPALPTASAATDTGDAEIIRAIATYGAFEDVPSDAELSDRGLELIYRFQAIPAVGISGAQPDVEALGEDPSLDRLEHDRELTYFSNTAIFSTDTAEVWQDPQWPNANDFDRPPIEVDTDGDGVPERIDGTGTTIAVVDTGVNGLHPDLWAQSTHIEGVTPFEPKLKECVNVPGFVVASTPYCDQTVGHGTHVAGIAAGNGWAAKNGLALQSPDEPYIGTAPGAQLVAAGAGAGIFVLDATASLDWMFANRERLNITVVNNSYGDTPGCSSSFPGGSIIALQDKFIEAGIPVIFAAGNYDPTGGPTWTGTYARNPTPGSISVANYDDFDTGTKNGAVNGGSSDGCVSTESSGDYVWTWPDVSAPGSSIASTASYTGTGVPPVWDPPFYASASGTSMSAPHVAGIVALMMQANPDLTPAEVEEILVSTADKWSDGVTSRSITGTDDMWGIPSGLADQGLATFLANDWDPSTDCRITPAMAQQAADGIAVDGLPRFEDLEDPENYVCRDYRRGAGLVNGYAAVQEAVARTGTTSPEVTIETPGDGETVPPSSIDVEGLVDRQAGDGSSNPAPQAELTPTPESGDPPLDVTFSMSAEDDGTLSEWSLDFGDGSTPAGDAGGPPSSVDHTYTEAGTYDAVLTVTDDEGATGTAQARIQVGGPDEVRIGTDPEGDTATGPCSDGAPACQTAWVDPADDGFDLTEAFVKDIGDDLRFTFHVKDADAFFEDSDGDPDAGDPAHIVSYQFTARFQTSPATVYTLNLERQTGDQELTTSLGKQLGALILNSNLGQGNVDKAGDVFWADVPKTELPELAVLGQINELEVLSQFSQEGAEVQLLRVMDTLDEIENDSYEVDEAATQAAAHALASEPLEPPSQVPEDAEITDPNGDVTAAGLPVDHMDIEAGWFEDDGDFLYAGVKVADIPADPTTTSQVAYHINFLPSWAQDASAWGATGTFTGIRAEAILSPVNAQDGTPSDGQHDFELQVLSDTTTGSTFSKVADLPLSTVDADNDLIWFVIPIDELRDPPTGATLSDLGADAVPAQQGLVTFGDALGDVATSDVVYELEGEEIPLSVDAGGPYEGAPGQTVTISAQPSGGQSPIGCTWTVPADVTIGDPNACQTTVSATQLSTYTLGVTVTDDAGDQATDSTTFTVTDAAGERVQIRLDGALVDAVPVSTSSQEPTEAWSTSIDLSGLSGLHAITAEWLDSDDSVLDTATVDVQVSTDGGPVVTFSQPSDGETVDGILAIRGQAGQGGSGSSGDGSTQQNTPAFGPGGLFETQGTVTREGTIAAPCAPCQDLGPSGSAAWFQPPGTATDGTDGRWLNVSGLAGSVYQLDARFDAPMDVYFYRAWENTSPTGSNVGPNDEKVGTIPEGSNLAFVYMRQPTTANPDAVLETVFLNASEPLGPPTGFTAQAGPDAITLSWSPPTSTGLSDVQAYQVYKDDMTTPVDQVDASTLTWTDSGLAEGEEHTYWVSAVNERTEGPKAGPSTAQTSQDVDTTPPSKVDGLSVTDITTSSVSLTWDEATDDTEVDGYNVYLDGTFQFSVTDTGAVVGGLDPETSYAFEVAAEDGARNEGERSDPIIATTEAATGETVTLHLDGDIVATIGVDTISQDPDDWATHVDTRTISDGPHTFQAVYDDGQGGTATTSIGVQVDNPDPSVEITGPSSQGQLAPPTDFQGTWTTDGDGSSQGQGGSAEAATQPGMREWIQDPYVQKVLSSDAYEDLIDELDELPGYLGAVPVTEDGGKLLVLLRGDVPSDLPVTELLDRPVEYQANTEPDTLMRPVAKAQNVVTPEEAGLQRTLSHQGPTAPGIQQGIGPGTAIQMDFGGSTFICTASYLYQDPSTETYYLATAGHCLLEEGAESSVSDPGAVADRVRLCYQDCVMNWVGLGTYVELSPVPSEGYHPVAFAQQFDGSSANAIGNDFGLIEIPEEINDLLRPHLWMWGGPTDFDRPTIGEPLAHYGHGTTLGLLVPTQGRLASTLSASQSAGIFAAGAIAGGDSGSAIGTAFPRTNSLLVGDGASGAITHGVVGVGAPVMWGTDLEHGLDMAQPALGFRPDLVTEDAEILPPGGEDPLGVTITTPPDGATVDPTETSELTVAGDGTFPAASGPGDGEITYWLHREDCGGSDDNPHMDSTKSPEPEGGDGCGSLAGPIGPAWELLIGEEATAFPSQPVPSEDIFLDPGDPVEASVWFSGYSGAAENPQPVPTVILDMEVRLTYSQGAETVTVGSQRITDEMGTGTPTEIGFSFLPEAPMIPAGAELTFTVVVHHAVGPVFLHVGGEHASNVVLPEGSAPERAVEISVDDPGFSSPITASGTSTWQASLDATSLATGGHTIYARAVQGDQVQDPPASVDVSIESTAATGPTAELVFDTHGLTADIEDTSQPGDAAITERTWQLGDGTTVTDVTELSHTYDEPGSYTVILTVEDADGRTDQVTAEVLVGGVDDHVVQVRLTGPDGEAFGWDTVADGELGADGDWARHWAPGPNPTEGIYSLSARMLNGGGVVATDEAGYDVVDPNFPPTLDPVEDHAVLTGDELVFTVDADDPDGDELTYSAPTLPDGATFDPETRTFAWTPEEEDLGDHTVRFEVTDGQASDAEEATISVIETAAVNQDTGQPYAFIQAAIDAATPGDTILVHPGTHETSLTIDKALTLVGDPANPETVVLDARGAQQVVLIDADGVTLRGMTLLADGTQDDGSTYGIDVPTSVLVTGLTVEEMIIEPANASQTAENAIRGRLADAHIQGNEMSGWATAVFLRPYGHDNTIADNQITAVGTGVSTWSPGTQIIGNTITGAGLQAIDITTVADDATTSADDNVLRDNDLGLSGQALRVRGDVTDTVIDARLNQWGVDDHRLIEERIDDQGTGNTIQFVPFRTTGGDIEPGLVRIQERADAAFLDVQAAIDAALPGETVLVPASQNIANPTPRPEAITVATEGVTVCGSVAGGPACLGELTEGHFELSASEWAEAPGDGAGQAVLFDLDNNAGRSTSHFPADGTQVGDIDSVAFDHFIETGDCGTGSPRVALWMDINGDGARTGQANANETILVYSDAYQAGDCVTGAWDRKDMLADDADARYVWNGTTYQTRQALVDAVDDEVPGHQVDAVNIQWDTGSGQIYIDDHTVNDALLGEPEDADCYITAGITCRWEGASHRAILQPDQSETTVANLTATGTTLEDLTLRWTGTPTQAIAGARLGADETRLANTTIEVQGGGCSAEDITAGGCYEPARTFGVLARDSPAGVEIVDNEIRGDIEDESGEIGGTTGIRGILPAGTMEGNFLTGWANHGAFVRGDALTVEANSFFTNMVGLKVCDDHTTQVVKNEFVGSSAAIAITECGNGEEPVFNDNQLGLTNAIALHVQSSVIAERFDATCNDWGVYNGLAVDQRVQNDGTEVEVDQTPFTGAAAGGLECLEAPSAAFTVEPQDQITRLDTVEFTSQASQGSRPILLHQWDFGDGGISLMENPSHTYDAVDTFEVRYQVTDLDGMISTAIQEIEVVNLAPELEDIGDIDVPHSTEVSFDVEANDPEGDELTYSIQPLPEGATFDDETGEFTWTPEPNQDGIHDLTVTVADPYDEVTDLVQVTVRNQAPVFQDLASNVAGNEELEISFPVVATDAEGDAVTLTADLPDPDMSFDATGGVGTFTWTPETGDAGTYDVTFTAESIGDKVTTEVVEIAVGAFNTPPTLTIDTPSHARPNTLLSVDASVTDPDSHEINWSVEAGPDVFSDSLSSDTGFSTTWEWWVPQAREDPIAVTFTADDGVNTVSQTVEIIPLKAPNAGFFDPIELASGMETTEVIAGQTIQLRAQAGDEDGSIVTAESDGFSADGGTVGPTTRPNAILWTAEATFPAGEHEVTFSVTDDDDLTTTKTQTIVAVANTAPEIEPIDDIEGNATGPQGLEVAVEANATDPDGRGIASYTWTIDGTDTVPGAQLHKSFSVGVHTVEIEVVDVNGASATETFTVAVDDALFAGEDLVGADKNADGVYIVDATAIVGDDPVLNISAADDLGQPAQGALITGDVYYTALQSNQDNRAQIDSISAMTDAEGNASIDLGKDLLGRATAPGHHVIELTVTQESRTGAPDLAPETAELIIRYYVGPDGPHTQL